MSFNYTDEVLDLLLKKTLGASYTSSKYAPGQQDSVSANIQNEQIFALPITNKNPGDFTWGASTNVSGGGTVSDLISVLGEANIDYTHIKKYENIPFSRVPITVGQVPSFRVWIPEDNDMKEKFKNTITGKSNFQFKINTNIPGYTEMNSSNLAYKPIINSGVLIFIGNSGNSIPNDASIVLKELYIYEGYFGSKKLNLTDLEDVTSTATVSGSTLIYDASLNEWRSMLPDSPVAALTDLVDVSIDSNTVRNNEVLIYDANLSKFVAGQVDIEVRFDQLPGVNLSAISENIWTVTSTIRAEGEDTSGNTFGEVMSYTDNNSYLAIGVPKKTGIATRSGAVYVYNTTPMEDGNPSAFIQLIEPPSSATTQEENVRFGSSVDIGNEYLIIGAAEDDLPNFKGDLTVNSGVVYSYIYNETTGNYGGFTEADQEFKVTTQSLQNNIGQVSLSNPKGMTIDSNENLYIVDTFYDAISQLNVGQVKKFNKNTGQTSIINLDSDPSVYQFSKPYGIIFDPVKTHRYRYDYIDTTVSKSGLNKPNEIKWDGTNYWIADTDNNRILKLKESSFDSVDDARYPIDTKVLGDDDANTKPLSVAYNATLSEEHVNISFTSETYPTSDTAIDIKLIDDNGTNKLYYLKKDSAGKHYVEKETKNENDTTTVNIDTGLNNPTSFATNITPLVIEKIESRVSTIGSINQSQEEGALYVGAVVNIPSDNQVSVPGAQEGAINNLTQSSSTGTGSGAIVDVTISGGKLTSYTIVSAGSGYVDGDTITIPAASIPGTTEATSDITITLTTENLVSTNSNTGNTTQEGALVQGVQVDIPSNDQQSVSGAQEGEVTNLRQSSSSGSGSGAIVDVTISGGKLASYTIVNSGSGYVVGDTITIPAASIPGTTAGETATDDITITITAENLTTEVNTLVDTVVDTIQKGADIYMLHTTLYSSDNSEPTNARNNSRITRKAKEFDSYGDELWVERPYANGLKFTNARSIVYDPSSVALYENNIQSLTTIQGKTQPIEQLGKMMKYPKTPNILGQHLLSIDVTSDTSPSDGTYPYTLPFNIAHRGSEGTGIDFQITVSGGTVTKIVALHNFEVDQVDENGRNTYIHDYYAEDVFTVDGSYFGTTGKLEFYFAYDHDNGEEYYLDDHNGVFDHETLGEDTKILISNILTSTEYDGVYPKAAPTFAMTTNSVNGSELDLEITVNNGKISATVLTAGSGYVEGDKITIDFEDRLYEGHQIELTLASTNISLVNKYIYALDIGSRKLLKLEWDKIKNGNEDLDGIEVITTTQQNPIYPTTFAIHSDFPEDPDDANFSSTPYIYIFDSLTKKITRYTLNGTKDDGFEEKLVGFQIIDMILDFNNDIIVSKENDEVYRISDITNYTLFDKERNIGSIFDGERFSGAKPGTYPSINWRNNAPVTAETNSGNGTGVQVRVVTTESNITSVTVIKGGRGYTADDILKISSDHIGRPSTSFDLQFTLTADDAAALNGYFVRPISTDMGDPTKLRLDSAGNIFVCESGDNKVTKLMFDGTNYLGRFTVLKSGLNNPVNFELDGDPLDYGFIARRKDALLHGTSIQNNSGFTDGTYFNVPTETDSEYGDGAFLTIVVYGGKLTSITATITGSDYSPGDELYVTPSELGGTDQENDVEEITNNLTFTLTKNHLEGVKMIILDRGSNKIIEANAPSNLEYYDHGSEPEYYNLGDDQNNGKIKFYGGRNIYKLGEIRGEVEGSLVEQDKVFQLLNEELLDRNKGNTGVTSTVINGKKVYTSGKPIYLQSFDFSPQTSQFFNYKVKVANENNPLGKVVGDILYSTREEIKEIVFNEPDIDAPEYIISGKSTGEIDLNINPDAYLSNVTQPDFDFLLIGKDVNGVYQNVETACVNINGTPQDGSGAKLTVIIHNDIVSSITVTDPGSGYKIGDIISPSTDDESGCPGGIKITLSNDFIINTKEIIQERRGIVVDSMGPDIDNLEINQVTPDSLYRVKINDEQLGEEFTGKKDDGTTKSKEEFYQEIESRMEGYTHKIQEVIPDPLYESLNLHKYLIKGPNDGSFDGLEMGNVQVVKHNDQYDNNHIANSSSENSNFNALTTFDFIYIYGNDGKLKAKIPIVAIDTVGGKKKIRLHPVSAIMNTVLSRESNALLTSIVDDTNSDFEDGVYTNLELYDNTYDGEGAICNITVTNGIVTNITVTITGSRYESGALLTLDDSDELADLEIVLKPAAFTYELPTILSENALSNFASDNNVQNNSGFADGTYENVETNTDSLDGSEAILNIVVDGGIVTSVTIVSPGKNYAEGDELYVKPSDIGGNDQIDEYEDITNKLTFTLTTDDIETISFGDPEAVFTTITGEANSEPSSETSRITFCTVEGEEIGFVEDHRSTGTELSASLANQINNHTDLSEAGFNATSVERTLRVSRLGDFNVKINDNMQNSYSSWTKNGTAIDLEGDSNTNTQSNGY